MYQSNDITIQSALMILSIFMISGSAVAGELTPPANATDSAGNPVATMKPVDQVQAWAQVLPNEARYVDVLYSSINAIEPVSKHKGVLDLETSLVWKSVFKSSSVTLQEAKKTCAQPQSNDVRLGWRLPTLGELTSVATQHPEGYFYVPVVNYNFNATIDHQGFATNISSDPSRHSYWTAEGHTVVFRRGPVGGFGNSNQIIVFQIDMVSNFGGTHCVRGRE
ncbi:MAG: hypothetical protein ACC707_20405 [Thiohalomonadales bacterium]